MEDPIAEKKSTVDKTKTVRTNICGNLIFLGDPASPGKSIRVMSFFFTLLSSYLLHKIMVFLHPSFEPICCQSQINFELAFKTL